MSQPQQMIWEGGKKHGVIQPVMPDGVGLNQKQYIIKHMTHRMGFHLRSNTNRLWAFGYINSSITVNPGLGPMLPICELTIASPLNFELEF